MIWHRVEMEVRAYDDVAAFDAAAGEFFLSEPYSANVIASQVHRILGSRSVSSGNAFYAAVLDGNEVAGVAMMTPPFHLFLSHMSATAARTLAEAILDLGLEVPGVSGEVRAVQAFAARWTGRIPGSTTMVVSMRMYRLDELRHPSRVPGTARAARGEDVDGVVAWLDAFEAEALPPEMPRSVASAIAQRIAAGEVMLWVDEARPVSVAAFRPAAAGVARIGPVYTPPQYRRRGYGAAATASATRAAIDRGAPSVALYADLANPISNSIYQSIGYVVDHDALHLLLPRR
jgi:predicted GNAT family acetyltransferase